MRGESAMLPDPIPVIIMYGTPEMIQKLTDAGISLNLAVTIPILKQEELTLGMLVAPNDPSKIKHVNLLYLAALYNKRILKTLFFNHEESFIEAFRRVYGENPDLRVSGPLVMS